MRAELQLGVCALCWAVFAQYAIAQSETNSLAQVEPVDPPAHELPGEYPEHLFREPYPPPVAETSEDFRQKYLLGDWLGARSQLAAIGIKPLVLLISDPFGNVTGGHRRGATEYDLLGIDVIVDSKKLLGWPGGEFRVGFSNNGGTSLSQKYIGNNFPVQLADVATPFPRLTYLNYTQSLFDEKVSFRFGRLTINSVYGEEFAASQYFKAFDSVGFNLIPQGIFFNAPGAFGYPLTTWGARLKVEPVESFYAMAGCYNGRCRRSKRVTVTAWVLLFTGHRLSSARLRIAGIAARMLRLFPATSRSALTTTAGALRCSAPAWQASRLRPFMAATVCTPWLT